MSLDLGALVEPLSVAMHANRRANLPPGSAVVVFGAGSVGLLTAAMSKINGASAVVIADIQKDRVDFAIDNGFADTGFVVPLVRPQSIDEKLKFAQEVARMARAARVNGESVDEFGAAFECTGVEACLQSGIYVSGSSWQPKDPNKSE
jgi:L-iditol 2-dehydrogenase